MLTRNTALVRKHRLVPSPPSSTTTVIDAPAMSTFDNPKKRPAKDDDVNNRKKAAISGWKPDDRWQLQLANIEKMRANRDAPVDTVGCANLADPQAPPSVHRFQVLLALMLSSQTKDGVTAAAMHRLKMHGCSIEDMIACTHERLEQLLIPVSFYRRKAIYIKKVAEIIRDKYNGDIPNSVDELMQLPGVGPKMAHLAMLTAWGQVTGIGVDTHVHRVANRLGWVPAPTKDPEKTRKALEDWMPRELWQTTNLLMVGFGQQTCLPLYPKCGSCLNRDICPYNRSKNSKP